MHGIYQLEEGLERKKLVGASSYTLPAFQAEDKFFRDNPYRFQVWCSLIYYNSTPTYPRFLNYSRNEFLISPFNLSFLGQCLWSFQSTLKKHYCLDPISTNSCKKRQIPTVILTVLFSSTRSLKFWEKWNFWPSNRRRFFFPRIFRIFRKVRGLDFFFRWDSQLLERESWNYLRKIKYRDDQFLQFSNTFQCTRTIISQFVLMSCQKY